MLEWLPPYEINVSQKNLGDFVYGTYSGLIISKKVKEIFEKFKLKGMSNFKLVKLFNRGRVLNVEYYYPDITFVNAFVDTDLLNLEGVDSCETCQLGARELNGIDGIVFLQPDKIHEDVFFPSVFGQGVIVISERFKRIIDEHSLSNVKLIEAEFYKWDALSPSSF